MAPIVMQCPFCLDNILDIRGIIRRRSEKSIYCRDPQITGVVCLTWNIIVDLEDAVTWLYLNHISPERKVVKLGNGVKTRKSRNRVLIVYLTESFGANFHVMPVNMSFYASIKYAGEIIEKVYFVQPPLGQDGESE